MESLTLPGCCVSRYVTLSEKDNDLRAAVRAQVFANGSSIAWCAVHPKHNSKFLEAFLEDKIKYEKLGDGMFFFYGTGQQFKDACNKEALRPVIEWEKKEGRKRNEKRVGDLVDIGNYIVGGEARVITMLKNGNVIIELTKRSHAYTYQIGQRLDNYGSGFTKDYFQIILPQEDNDK